jgi:hypothetical protein
MRKNLFLAPALLVSSLWTLSSFCTAIAQRPAAPINNLGASRPGLAPIQNPLLTPPISVAPPAPRPGEKFPWKEKIVTTTFWVGEAPTKNNPVPNHVSSWDENWAANFGGTDDPDITKRVSYLPAAFVPRQNPFYVALPYNDLTRGGHKIEAAQVIPWFKKDFQRPGKTVLKGRWVAIRFQGRTAYAQWEDCGPFRTDHYQYVFGNERPKANLNRGAGLDVSPAVRDFLGMAGTDVTDWRFADFDEVPQGPWATHGDNNTFVINQRLKNDGTATVRAASPSVPAANRSVQ